MITNDERMATCVDLVVANPNVRREKEAAEHRAALYKSLWEDAMRENDALRLEISALNRELIRQRMMFGEYWRRLA